MSSGLKALIHLHRFPFYISDLRAIGLVSLSAPTGEGHVAKCVKVPSITPRDCQLESWNLFDLKVSKDN